MTEDKANDATPEEHQSIKHRHYLQIREKSREVKDALSDWQRAKDLAAEDKKRYDRLNSELLELIQRGPDPQRLLPLGDPGEWRSRPITELGLADSLTDKLAENEIETLGQLHDFWQSGKYLSDITGIGSEKSATIADAFADYGKEHPELFDESEPPESDDQAA